MSAVGGPFRHEKLMSSEGNFNQFMINWFKLFQIVMQKYLHYEPTIN